jgi:hypothetical protein
MVRSELSAVVVSLLEEECGVYVPPDQGSRLHYAFLVANARAKGEREPWLCRVVDMEVGILQLQERSQDRSRDWWYLRRR